MNRGFHILLVAQFLSALADNALLFAAIALLAQLSAPPWQIPVLQQFFVFSYILLAPFVGAFADSLPKGRVMFISNAVKIVGCTLMLVGVHPLAAYAVVGLGAAMYSPAKYGILTELLPPRLLVLANGWMEGLTVAAIVLGAILGGALVSDRGATPLHSLLGVSGIDPFFDSAPKFAIAILLCIYALASVVNLYIPAVPADRKPASARPLYLVREFRHCFRLLWRDPLGQVSLAVTTLFWGAGATLRLIIIAWASVALGFSLEESARLTAVVAVGIAVGAAVAAKTVELEHSVRVLPVGIAMGLAVIAMTFVEQTWVAVPLLALIGALGGYFVVPMNALLQHRGHLLMGAGHSIAVQNFNENLSIIVMLGAYALMIRAELSVYTVVILFGVFVATTMGFIWRKHGHDQD
ncbi:MAG: lysophospholipid transporter LplT [Proteobacteria bacterium]|nr:lysophospholipid transporter LplT [Burkholderiales bacterium]